MIRTAARAIRDRRLVVFPTETVYGIAALASPDVIDRLDRAKGRAAEKRYTLHVADPGELASYIPRPDARARKLIRLGWPGPVTMVFPLSPDTREHMRHRLAQEAFDALCVGDSLGIRCPDHPVAHDLLAAVGGPVVAPSANVSGEPPATTAAEAHDRLAGRVDVVLDSDAWAPCRYAAGSTVVRLDRAGWKVLRAGAVPVERIREMCTLHILVVCTGNTCRSPIAEGFLRKRLSEKLNCDVDALEGVGYKVASAGVAAAAGQPASPEAVQVGHESGFDLRRHRSTPVDRGLLDQADVVLVLADGHRRQILEAYPHVAAKVQRLDEQGDVPDPIGCDVDVYRRCAEMIRRAVNKRMDEMIG